MRTSVRWTLGALMAVGLTACHPNGAAVDTSSIGDEANKPTAATRWVSYSAAWDQTNVGYSSYAGAAFGPGSAVPVNRNTLNNPDPSVDYVAHWVPAAGESPQVGEARRESAHEAAPFAPSDDYYVNGRDLGPSVDRAPGTGGPAKLTSPQP